jgi:hypothetical protein
MHPLPPDPESSFRPTWPPGGVSVPDPSPPLGDPTASDPIAEAIAYGLDLSLVDECLRLSPSERMRRHDQALRLYGLLRRAKPDPNAGF